MANYSIANNQVGAYEKTMTANQVDTYTFDAQALSIEVINHDGNGAIYLTLDGTTPVIASSNCYMIPGAVTADEFLLNITALKRPTVIKLISSGTPRVSVMRSDLS